MNKQNIHLRTPILLGFLFMFTACYKNNEEELYGPECQTINISYSETIEPLLSNQCLGCHSSTMSSSIGGGINLEGYTNVKIKVDDGRLFGALNHESGFTPMPLNGAKLNECSLSMIEIWINEGALNN